MVIVFLPTVVGCKTTLIIYGPKRWGQAKIDDDKAALLVKLAPALIPDDSPGIGENCSCAAEPIPSRERY